MLHPPIPHRFLLPQTSSGNEGQPDGQARRKCNGNRHQLNLSWPKRLRQNLSFVIRPSDDNAVGEDPLRTGGGSSLDLDGIAAVGLRGSR